MAEEGYGRGGAMELLQELSGGRGDGYVGWLTCGGGGGRRGKEGKPRVRGAGLKGVRATGRRDGALVLAVPMATARGNG